MTIAEHYERIAPKLTNYLVASGLDYATASDIVQETFLRVWKRRDELMDDEAQVSGFVYTIARNLRTDLARKNSRLTFQEEITDEDVKETVQPQRDLEKNEENAALRKKLNAALQEVPPLLREAFLLFQISGLSIREIARQTNSTESLVKVRIHRAKEKLKVLLSV